MDTTALRVARRLDRLALDQLRQEVTRLAAENDQLRADLTHAQENADFWANEATEQHLKACELSGERPGITRACQLVGVRPDMET